MKTKLFALLMCMLPLSPLSAKNNVTDTTACKAWIVDAFRKNILEDLYTDTILRYQIFTREMWEKKKRVGAETGADPFVRAQDYNDYMLENVKARHLGGNWFEVSYAWSDTAALKSIPVRVEQHGTNDYRINYVTPYWGEKWMGDSLFDIKTCEVNAQGSALEFVRSFYCRYTYLYATMVPDLAQQLAEMRQTHCTVSLNRRFAELQKELEGELEEGYDLFVMACDFDIYWFRSLKVEPLTDTSFEVSYRVTNNYERKWSVKVAKEGNRWKIEEIETKTTG